MEASSQLRFLFTDDSSLCGVDDKEGEGRGGGGGRGGKGREEGGREERKKGGREEGKGREGGKEWPLGHRGCLIL